MEAGVEGYIKAQVKFDLNDDPNPGTGFYVNNDPSQGYVPLGTQSLGGITDDKSSLHSFNAGIQGGLGAE